AILLKVNEISVFGANELHGVKPFVVLGISGNFRETFIPLPIADYVSWNQRSLGFGWLSQITRPGRGCRVWDPPTRQRVGERSRNVSWNQRFDRVRTYRGCGGGGSDWGGAYMAVVCLPCVRPGAAGFAARTHRKKRDVRATRERQGLKSWT